jgi:hypothetical protein
LPSRRTPPVLPEKHFEQIANPSLLSLLREGMTQRQVGLHLVDVSPTNSLADDVAVLDQLGDDPMGASFRHPHGLGDVAQTNAGVVRDAQQDLRVVREELVLGQGAVLGKKVVQYLRKHYLQPTG